MKIRSYRSPDEKVNTYYSLYSGYQTSAVKDQLFATISGQLDRLNALTRQVADVRPIDIEVQNLHQLEEATHLSHIFHIELLCEFEKWSSVEPVIQVHCDQIIN